MLEFASQRSATSPPSPPVPSRPPAWFPNTNIPSRSHHFALQNMCAECRYACTLVSLVEQNMFPEGGNHASIDVSKHIRTHTQTHTDPSLESSLISNAVGKGVRCMLCSAAMTNRYVAKLPIIAFVYHEVVSLLKSHSSTETATTSTVIFRRPSQRVASTR